MSNIRNPRVYSGSIKATSKKQKRLAKKAFPKVARNERPFSKADYDALPKE